MTIHLGFSSIFLSVMKIFFFLQVNEAGDKVRRNIKNPLPEDTKEYKEDLTSRTIYAVSSNTIKALYFWRQNTFF